MRKIINNFVYLGLAIVITMLCDSCQTEPMFYQLEVPHSIASTKDTLSIGDTLWIEGDFPDKLYDKRSSNSYFFKDKLPIYFIADKIAPVYKEGPKCFDIVNVIGASTRGSTIFFTDYTYQNNRFRTKFGLVAKETGLFNLAFASSINDMNDTKGENVDFNAKIDKEYATLIFKTTSQYLSNHYELVENLLIPSGVKRWEKDTYIAGGCYAFVVK